LGFADDPPDEPYVAVKSGYLQPGIEERNPRRDGRGMSDVYLEKKRLAADFCKARTKLQFPVKLGEH